MHSALPAQVVTEQKASSGSIPRTRRGALVTADDWVSLICFCGSAQVQEAELQRTRDNWELLDPGNARSAEHTMRVGCGSFGLSIAAHYDARITTACNQALMSSPMSLRTCPVRHCTPHDV